MGGPRKRYLGSRRVFRVRNNSTFLLIVLVLIAFYRFRLFVLDIPPGRFVGLFKGGYSGHRGLGTNLHITFFLLIGLKGPVCLWLIDCVGFA